MAPRVTVNSTEEIFNNRQQGNQIGVNSSPMTNRSPPRSTLQLNAAPTQVSELIIENLACENTILKLQLEKEKAKNLLLEERLRHYEGPQAFKIAKMTVQKAKGTWKVPLMEETDDKIDQNTQSADRNRSSLSTVATVSSPSLVQIHPILPTLTEHKEEAENPDTEPPAKKPKND